MEIVQLEESTGPPFQQWNKHCFGCHVSQEQKRYRPEDDAYSTEWVDFGTSCERCHGPGQRHIEAYTRVPGGDGERERSIVKPTRLDPSTSSMICAQCHSLRSIIDPGYTAGENYYDFFSPHLDYDRSQGRAEPYWTDSRPRRFSNDAIGLWESACFLQGGVTCTSCHRDPHQPDVTRMLNSRRRATRCARAATRTPVHSWSLIRDTPRTAPAVPASNATCRRR
jgi:hypothetical protein